jgi:hypothetical protein
MGQSIDFLNPIASQTQLLKIGSKLLAMRATLGHENHKIDFGWSGNNGR